MDWKELYRNKLISAEQAVGKIFSGSSVVTSHAAAEPQTILRAMASHKENFRNVRIFNLMSMGELPTCQPGMESHFLHNTTFVSMGTREAVNTGRACFTTSFYSETPWLLREVIPVDVAVLSLSRPDRHGYCSFGVTLDYQRLLAEKAGVVIAQVNELMPRTHGDCFIHVSQLDYIVEVSEPLPELPEPRIGDVERGIGKNCASLIRDGDTLQLGIGAIPDAVLLFLKDKNDLGIHSEMFSDGVAELMEMGVITNRAKTLNRDVSVATFLIGSKRLYDFVDDNPSIRMFPVDYTNNPCIIAQNDNMVAINSCLQVDLYGQVAADTLGPKQYSGAGGQVDFVRGANMSRGGRAIFAVPSTAAGGKESRIVADLKPGAAVTTTRNDVNYVVTEYGVAQLKGKTLRARALALAAIAHPAFRDQLYEEANRRFWI
ncbi:MAG: hypothetical protein LBR61_01390 [Synergistaceae bacterium]|jgi:4-hydroxybutyrate CoA-transferase|nr:hypothetical protein [Synergistaceae bacterium]